MVGSSLFHPPSLFFKLNGYSFGQRCILLLEQSCPVEDVEILVQGAVVEGHYLHKVLDEDKLRGEMRQRNEAEVLVLTRWEQYTRKDDQKSLITTLNKIPAVKQ